MHTFYSEELAWAAGFFDGEGTTNTHSRGIRFVVAQKDSFLLYKFRGFIGGYGTVYKKNSKSPINSNISKGHALDISNFEHVQYCMCLLWKWLGPQKKEQYKDTVKNFLFTCKKPNMTADAIYQREYSRKIKKHGSKAMIYRIQLYKAEQALQAEKNEGAKSY